MGKKNRFLCRHMPKKAVSPTAPQKNAFSKHLEKQDLKVPAVAEDLDLTRSYVYMLISGAATPGLKTAIAIQIWSKGGVPIESWRKPR